MESNLLLEFLEDMFCWMEEEELESLTQDDVIFFLRLYAQRAEAEAEGLKQMQHKALINKILGESGIDVPEE